MLVKPLCIDIITIDYVTSGSLNEITVVRIDLLDFGIIILLYLTPINYSLYVGVI